MCIAPAQLKGLLPQDDDDQPKVPKNATEVPLGDGMVGQARLSILGRREQIRRAVEDGM